jgi:MFS family permease
MVVGLLWLAGFSAYITRTVLVTMHGSIVHAIPMTETQFGLLTSVFLLIYAALNPIGGLLADRFSRTAVIVASVIAWSSLTWLTAYARTFNELLLLRAAMGAAQACYLPASSAIISDYHPGPTRSRAIGLHMMGLVFGSTLGGLGGWVAEEYSWGLAFKLLGLPGIMLGVVLAVWLRDLPRAAATETCPAAPEDPVRFGTAVFTLLASGSVIAMMFCFLLQNAISWVVIGWMPTYLHERFNLAQGAAGLSATAYLYTAQIIGLLVSGAWSDRWSRTNPRARIYVPVIGLCLSTPGFLIAAHSPTLGLTILCLALWGLATGFMGSNVMPILCLITDRRYRATAYGLANGVGAVAGGLSILGAGAMRDLHFDLSRGLVFAGLAAAICAVLFLVIRLKGSEAA